MNSNTLSLRIEVDDNGSIKVRNLGKDLEETGTKGKRAADGMDRAFGALKTTLGGIALFALTKQVVGLMDQYTLLESRLGLVTKGSENLADVQKKLYDISLRTHVANAETINLYTRLARATDTLGYSQATTLQITETINQALIVSGASATESGAALIQLSQGLATGVLRGEEFNSVMEQTPRLARAIADGLGVQIGQLRAMAEDGKLTSEVVTRALISQKEAIEREFGQMKTTIGQAMTDLGTVYANLVHEADKGAAGTGRVVKSIQDLTSTIEQNKKPILALFEGMVEGAAKSAEGIVTLIGTIGNFGGTIQSVYDSTVGLAGADALDWGIFGAILFKGSPGHAALAAGIITINNQLSHFDMNIGSLSGKWAAYSESFNAVMDGLSGRRDFNTGAWISELQQVDNQIKALRDSQQNKPWQLFPDPVEERRRSEEIKKSLADLEAKRTEIIAGNDRYIDSWQRASIASGKSLGNDAVAVTRLKDAWQVYSDLRTTSAKAIEDAEDRLYKEKEKRLAEATEKQKKHAEEVVALEATLTDEIKRGTLSRYEYAVWALEQETAKRRQLAGENQKVQGEITEAHRVGLVQAGQFSDMYASEEQERLTKMRDFFMQQEEDKTSAVAENYKKQESLRAELDVYLENIGNDELARALSRLEKEYQAKVEIAQKDKLLLQQLAEWKKSREEQITRENQERMLQEKLRERDIVANHLHDLTLKNQDYFLELTALEQVWAETSRTIKSELGNALVEEFGRIGGAWGALWDSMLMKMGEVVAEMAVNWTVSQIGNMFEGWNIYHAGIWNLREDEVPSILQQGEMVIPADVAEDIRANMGNHGPDNWGGLMEATRNYGVSNWGADTDGVVAANMGKQYSGMAITGTSGVIAGQMSIGEVMAGMMSPQTAVGVITTALTETGVSVYSPEPSNFSNFGAGVGKGFSMVGLAGLGLPGMAIGAAGALGGLVGGWVGDLIGDVFDARTLDGYSVEAIYDAYEDGKISAEQKALAVAALNDRFGWERAGLQSAGTLGAFAAALGSALDGVGSFLSEMLGFMAAEHATTISQPGDFTGYDPYGGFQGWEVGQGMGSGVTDSYGNPAGVGRTDESKDEGYGSGGASVGNPGDMGAGDDGWWAKGGIVNRLLVPKGEDGWGALKLGEGVIDADTMKILSNAIRAGQFPTRNGDNEELVALLWTIASSTKKSADILTRFEYTGIPQSERRAVA